MFLVCKHLSGFRQSRLYFRACHKVFVREYQSLASWNPASEIILSGGVLYFHVSGERCCKSSFSEEIKIKFLVESNLGTRTPFRPHKLLTNTNAFKKMSPHKKGEEKTCLLESRICKI